MIINDMKLIFNLNRSGSNVLLNVEAGQMLKTKYPSTDEGGVGYGASALDTPLLIPDEKYIELLSQR